MSTTTHTTTVRYMASWYGGPNYRAGDAGDREPVASIREAADMLRDRYSNRDGFTPCVSDESDIYLYAPGVDEYGRPAEYPSHRVYFGPRGGVRVERV